MATGLKLLTSAYDSSNSEEEEDTSLPSNENEHLKPVLIKPELSIASSISIDSAPLVLYSVRHFFFSIFVNERLRMAIIKH